MSAILLYKVSSNLREDGDSTKSDLGCSPAIKLEKSLITLKCVKHVFNHYLFQFFNYGP